MQLPDTLAKHFQIFALKRFSRSDLFISWDDQLPQLSSVRTQQEDCFWESFQKQKPESTLFNGVLCQMRGFNFDSTPMQLQLGPVHFKTHLFSILKGPVLSEPPGTLLMGLGVSAVVISSNNQILFMKRSRHVATSTGLFDVFGGHIDPERHETLQVGNGLVPDPFLAIAQELEEELNLKPEQIATLEGIGLIANRQTAQLEMIFRCHTTVDANTISGLAQRAKDRTEYSHLIIIPNRVEKLQTVCLKYATDFSPSGLASLWLHFLLLREEKSKTTD